MHLDLNERSAWTRCIAATPMQAAYDLVDANAVQYLFVGHHRYSFKEIFGLFRPIIAV